MICLQRRSMRLAEQLAKTLLASHPHPHHQRVHEESDQLLQLGVLPIRNGRPNHDVVLTAVPRQQRSEGRKHRHIKRRVMAPTHSLQCRRLLGAQLHPAEFRLERLNRRPRSVGRQLQQIRYSRQMPLPIRHLFR